MSDSLWSLIAIIVLVALCVRAVALVSPSSNLRMLPVHRRFRVEWCTAHARQVELAGAALVVLLAALPAGTALLT